MSQISPLELISNSAFNDCSVTVICSAVIITVVLLLCDWPIGPSPSLFRADVLMVFWDFTPAPIAVPLCILVVSCSAKCTLHLPTDNVVEPRVRDDGEPSHSPTLCIDHGAACPDQINTYLQPVMLPPRIQTSKRPHVWMCVRAMLRTLFDWK